MIIGTFANGVVFLKGDRVVENDNTPRSARRTRDGIFRTGTVVGFSRDRECVWVAWDGYKTRIAYHLSFLDKAATVSGQAGS